MRRQEIVISFSEERYEQERKGILCNVETEIVAVKDVCRDTDRRMNKIV